MLVETPCCVCLSVSGKVFVVALKHLRVVTEIDSGELLQFRWVAHAHIHTYTLPSSHTHFPPPQWCLHNQCV